MCSAIITKNKPQKGRELLHSLPCCSVRSRDLEDLGKLLPDIPLREQAPSFFDPGQHFIADLTDLLGGDGVAHRLEMQLTLVVDDRVKVEAHAVSQVILQSSLGDVAIPKLGIESQNQHKPVFQRIGHVVALDKREAVASLHEGCSVHFPFFIGEMSSPKFVVTFIGDVEFDLHALLIEDGLGAHSPSELDIFFRIKDPPECGFLVLGPPVEGLLLIFDCSVGGVLFRHF